MKSVGLCCCCGLLALALAGCARPLLRVQPSGASAMACGPVSALEPNADFRGYALARAGPVWFSDFGRVRSGPAVLADAKAGAFTKVVIHPDAGLRGAVQLSGYSCATGQPLRFCYDGCQYPPAAADPTRWGEPALTVAAPHRGDLTGYIYFPATGNQRFRVEQTGREVGFVVVRVAAPSGR